MAEKFIKVINVQILTLATREGLPDENAKPILRFELEDAREFFMVNIPFDIARNIAAHITDQSSSDSRLQVHELINELALVEKIEIDLLLPGQDVYQATINLVPEGFERGITLQMIPSHATLLAVVNDAPIFIADELITQAEEMRKQDV
ncbi:MAG: hypothetical protein HeimC2_22080 [Candidatus Heimdallarchaeota archaeon LC_2]|nr:MAG: hypothetical protein HeimC2_22080 [Candidatus Heimdallarchaeota archaeon LC_2]